MLNVKTYEEVLTAIYTVYRSRQSERVKAYSAMQGMEQSHQIAVVVKLMAQPEISGVLFTADPITGSHANMTGITNIGVPLSHAAIVAREPGIPAIVGCGNATTRLKTGDRVIVDGGQGVVRY